MPNTRIRLCIVGAAGRMGGTIIREAPPERFEISGAIEAPSSPSVGKSLSDSGIGASSVRIQDSSKLKAALEGSDVCLSFTQPAAEVENADSLAESGRPAVIGTTGLSPPQMELVQSTLGARIPAVISSNFSIGANTLFALSASLKNLPGSFDVSLSEIHHSGKADAPSGTAVRLGEILSNARGYTSTVYGRSGLSKRKPGELEVSSLRGGGVPGVHTVFAFGPNEMLRVEHVAFSRAAFATGALLAAEWVAAHREPGVYSMMDVLGFRS